MEINIKKVRIWFNTQYILSYNNEKNVKRLNAFNKSHKNGKLLSWKKVMIKINDDISLVYDDSQRELPGWRLYEDESYISLPYFK